MVLKLRTDGWQGIPMRIFGIVYIVGYFVRAARIQPTLRQEKAGER